MATRQYIGARYVPKFSEPLLHDSTKSYEALTIVADESGNSYTSKQFVPVGIALSNTRYWVITGNYNAQVEQYRIETARLSQKISSALQGGIGFINPIEYGAAGDGVTDDTEAITEASKHGIICDPNHTYFINGNCVLENGSVYTTYKINQFKGITLKHKLFAYNTVFGIPESFTTDRGNFAVDIKNVNGATIIGNEFYDLNNALYIDRCDGAIVSDNYLHDLVQSGESSGGNGYGVLTIQSNDCTISNNIFKAVARHSIYISVDETSVGSKNVLIANNTFNKEGAVGTLYNYETEIHTRNVKNLTVCDNQFYNVLSPLWCLGQVQPDDVSSENITVKNNTIYSCVANRTVDGLFTFYGNAEGTKVSNIVIDNNMVYPSIMNFCRLGESENVEITNNNYTSKGEIIRGFVVVTSDCTVRSLLIKNNKIVHSNSEKGVLLYYSGHCTTEELIVENNNIVSKNLFIMIGDKTLTVTTFKLINNNIELGVTRDYPAFSSITNLYLYGNRGAHRFAMYMTPTNYYTDGYFDIINVAASDTTYRNLNPKMVSRRPWGTADLYVDSNMLASGAYYSIDTLPTENIDFGTIANCQNGKSYVWINQWRELTN